MSGKPEPEQRGARALLHGSEKEIFSLVAGGSDKRFEWLMPMMQRRVLRQREAEERRRKEVQERRRLYCLYHDADSDTEDQDREASIQPLRPGAFEDQMFDCAAEGNDAEWREFLRIPIEEAAFAGRQDLVERLRLAGAPTDCIIVEATRGGHEQFVSDMSLFVDDYCLRGATDKNGNTALHIAARYGREQIARTLLLTSADKRAFNRFGDAPLHVAIKYGQLSVARALLLARADPGLEQQYDDDLPWDDTFGLGNSPLKLALQTGENRLAMMELLLRHGAEPDDGEEYGFTALWSAAHNNDLDAVNLLLVAGASPQDDDNGESAAPISVAALASNVDIALSLLRHGSKPNVNEVGGRSTLGFATRCPEMLDLLLRWGADEKVLSGWAGTAGLTAKKERCVRMLLANAPQDRAWRGRGLPVLCRAFPDRCMLEQEHRNDSTQARAAWMEPNPTARKRQRLRSGLVSDPSNTERNGKDDLGSGVEDGEESGECKSSNAPEFSRLTARLLLSLREDNVFRHIVEYL